MISRNNEPQRLESKIIGRGNSKIIGRGNSKIIGRGNSKIIGRENSSPENQCRPVRLSEVDKRSSLCREPHTKRRLNLGSYVLKCAAISAFVVHSCDRSQLSSYA